MSELAVHPVLRLPTLEEMQRLGRQGTEALLAQRAGIIREEKDEPLTRGWEPPIWHVCDALLGWNFAPEDRREERARWNAEMREALGFGNCVDVLLINGGNRGGKSHYAAKRCNQVLFEQGNRRAWILHSKRDRSVEDQQPLIYQHFPRGLRGRDVRERTTYVAYKQKTGFSEDSFVLPNGSHGAFMFYTMDRAAAVEGGEVDLIWNDELVPYDWVETEELRIATRAGKILITFTPVDGYSATVKAFQDGADVAKWGTGFLLPVDGQEADEVRALGFDSTAERDQAKELGPACKPTDCDAWLRGETGQPTVPAGRRFEEVPRVMRPVGSMVEGRLVHKRAVVFFHSNDNPYGNPKQVMGLVRGQPRAFVAERFYGLANKTSSARFPKFNDRVHVLPDAAMPTEMTRYLLGDPASGRNFFWLWVGVTPMGCYVYREWPGGYRIPGVGAPGTWAEPDAKRPDGRRGPAQRPFGFGLWRYKCEVARLEGWPAYWLWRQKEGIGEREEDRLPSREEVEGWEAPEESMWAQGDPALAGKGRRGRRKAEAPGRGAAGLWSEAVAGRFLDSRAASSPKIENDRPVTLQTEFDEMGLHFDLTPGARIDDGVHEVNSLLDYDTERPVEGTNVPRLYVAQSCRNTIFALKTWTGEDGQKGACKEPIDLLRYFALLDLAEWVSAEDWGKDLGGGHY